MKTTRLGQWRTVMPVGIAVLGGVLILAAARAPAKPVEGDAASATSSSAAPAKPKSRHCLVGGNYDQTIIDENTMILTDRFASSARVKVQGCRLNASDPLVFEFRGTTQICSPNDLDVSSVSVPGIKTRCFVDSITPVKRNADGQWVDDKS